MTIHFLHISDTHLGQLESFELAPNVNPFDRTRLLVDRICDWCEHDSVPIDFVVHTGDLVHRGHVSGDNGESTRLGFELLRRIPRPIHFTVGNHDHRSALMGCIGNPPGLWVPGIQDRWSYHFSCGKERFVVLDARGPLELDPRGSLCDAQLAFVSSFLQASEEPVTFFVHYPPVPLDCDWIDRTMLIENGIAFHNCIRSHASRVRGVFFGHVHRPTTSVRDGILYASTGSVSMHFPNWPKDAAAIVETDPIGFANYIQIDDQGVLIKTHWVCPPAAANPAQIARPIPLQPPVTKTTRSEWS